MIKATESPVRLGPLSVLLGLISLPGGCGGSGAGALPDYPTAQLEGRDPAEDWTAWLGSLLPAVLACVEATEGEARVIRVEPAGDGRAAARLVNDSRETWDCMATVSGPTVDLLEPRGRNLPRRPGEADSILTPASGRPPSGACYTHESLRDEAGRLLGWLSYDLC
jgi:hypothetical protein